MRNLPLCLLFILSSASAQYNTGIEPALHNNTVSGLMYAEEMRQFYAMNNYQFQWLPADNRYRTLTALIERSAAWGLQASDYQPALTPKNMPPASKTDSINIELRLTDAALRFLHDLYSGNTPEQFSYEGLRLKDNCLNLPALLYHYLSVERLATLPAEIEPNNILYASAKAMLEHYTAIAEQPGFTDALVVSPLASTSNRPLMQRLYQLGILLSDTVNITPQQLDNKIKEVQDLFGLLRDGRLRTTVLEAMNVPLRKRIASLENTLNFARSISCFRDSTYLIVNIPSATLQLWDGKQVVLESRIIAGKPSTPTPTLSSRVTESILYPFWHVPYKIAVNELLPRIKQDRNYLEANNFQVLLNGRVVDPSAIKWNSLSRNHFPYTIRQSTGCDNSLGIIKLNFYNPFSVYLHDTPNKTLFGMNKRFFSHGCMRLEKAEELARFISGNNTAALDSLSIELCRKDQAPVTVPAQKNYPIFVVYHTAWPDAGGHLRFFEDIYHKEK